MKLAELIDPAACSTLRASTRATCGGCANAKRVGDIAASCTESQPGRAVAFIGGKCPIGKWDNTIHYPKSGERRPRKIEIRGDVVLICTGCRNDWPVDAWRRILDSHTGFEGSKLVVPRDVYESVKAKFRHPYAPQAAPEA